MSEVIPAGSALHVLAERVFDRSAGLRSPTSYALELDRHGLPWLATEDGLYSYSGGQWRREPMPLPFREQQVRSLLFARNGARWVGTRHGLYVQRVTGEVSEFGEAEGVVGPVVYSLAETRAIDGTWRIVAGASRGVSYYTGARFVPLALPDSFNALGLMVVHADGPDAVPELWVASSTGGVLRLREKRWTSFAAAQGLDSPSAQHLLIARDYPAGRVFVACATGVYVLQEQGTGGGSPERFVRIPGSPALAYRLEHVRAHDGRNELWVGTTDGRVMRWREGRWSVVPTRVSDAHGSVSLLRAVPRHGGGTAVYLSARGSRLTRLSIGAAGTLAFPARGEREFVNALEVERRPDGRDALWIGTSGAGLIHVAADGIVRRYERPLTSTFITVSVLARASIEGPRRARRNTPAVSPSLLVVGDGRLYRMVGMQLVPMQNGLPAGAVLDVRRARLPSGEDVLTAATTDGLFLWNGSRWARAPFALDGGASSVRDAVINGEPTLLVGGEHTVRRVTARGVDVDSIPEATARAAGDGLVLAACLVPGTRPPKLFALDNQRGIFWRSAARDGAWQPLPAELLRAISPTGALTLRCRGSEEILVGSPSGLMAANVASPDAGNWHVVTHLADADGLPASHVTAISARDSDRTIWLGTAYGVGLVDLAVAALPPQAQLQLRVISQRTGHVLSADARLTPDDDDIRVEPLLQSFHREEEARYLVKLSRVSWFDTDSEASASLDGPGARPGETRSESGERAYNDLDAGHYVLQVRAFDWAGRAYGPVEQHFRIAPTFARSWYAVLLLAALVVFGLTAAYRWRVSVLQRGTLRLVESERRLRESERKFRTIFDRSTDAHLLVDDGRVQIANERAVVLFGALSTEQLQDRAISDLLPELSFPTGNSGHHGQPIETTIMRESAAAFAGAPPASPGAAPVPVQCSVTRVPIDQRELQHIVLRDLTSVREAEAERAWFETQVREAQKLESLGTLAGGVAHDFNNLLGVIRGNAELAKSATKKGRSSEEHLAAILDASDRARDVVRQILTFSRRSTPTREYVNLSRLVLDLQPLLRRMIPRNLRMVIEGAEIPHLMMGDPTQLQQLLLNLVSNAEYAMRERPDGMLSIVLQERTVLPSESPPHGDVVVLQVKDTGDGMSDEVRSRIFEPFFTTKPTGEGTGLGMAVLHGIVVSHQGYAEVTSEVGRGTTLELLFPRAVVEGLWDEEEDPTAFIELDGPERGHDAGVLPEAEDFALQSLYAGSRIVVVDDEAAVARVVERALQHHGQEVHAFLQPEAALAFIRNQPSAVDLLITDQTMPGMTGDLLAEAVHALRVDLPVIILTGFSHRLTPERVAAARAYAVLLKPVELDDLRKTVDDALGARAR